MAATGHNFFAWRGPGIKDWNRVFAPVPSNYTLLNGEGGEAQMLPNIAYDLVLCQNKMGQFPIAKQLASKLHIPLIHLEHTLPHPEWDGGIVRRMKQMSGDTNVFISDYSRQAWLYEEQEGVVIEHGVDTTLFQPPPPEFFRRPVILSVVNDWINRDYCCGFYLWKEITKDLPCYAVGDTPGLSSPAQNTAELVFRYQQHSIFINTATASPIPTVLLEAMACGCAVVSTENPMTTNVIQNGVNGFISNDKTTMRQSLERLLASPDLCRKLGEQARKTVEDRHSLSSFVSNWNNVLYSTANKVVNV
jgi:glycosyltransferase involved in cell wall biosynthesis